MTPDDSMQVTDQTTDDFETLPIVKLSEFRFYAGDKISVNSRGRDLDLSLLIMSASPSETGVSPGRSVERFLMRPEVVELCRVRVPREGGVNMAFKILSDMARSDELIYENVKDEFDEILRLIKENEEHPDGE